MIVFLRRKRNTGPQAASNLDSHWKLEYSFDGKKWYPIHYDNVKLGSGLSVGNFRMLMNRVLQGRTVKVSAAKQLDSGELEVYGVLEELEASV